METTNTGRAFTRYSYLGTTDEHTTCDCCGKEDLKSTVGIRDIETGEERARAATGSPVVRIADNTSS